MEQLKKLLKELEDLELPKDQYAVFGSGPMAIRGIRDVEDLDIIVKPEIWEELSLRYSKESKRLIKVGEIDIYQNWKPWFEDVDELIDSADIIDGIHFVKLEYVLEWKKAMKREKDRKDAKLIEEYLIKNKTKEE